MILQKVMAFCVVGVCVNTTIAAVLFDDFETGDFSGLESAVANSWSVNSPNPPNVEAAVVSDGALAGQHSLRLFDDSATGSSAGAVGLFAGTKGNSLLRLTFLSQVTPLGDNYSAHMILRQELDPRVHIRWFNDERLQYRNAAGAWITYGNFAPGATQQFTLLYDEQSTAVSIWVDGQLLLDNETAAVRGDAAEGVDRISFSSGIVGSSQVDWYLDNIQLEVLPEPTTLALVGLVGGILLFTRRKRLALE